MMIGSQIFEAYLKCSTKCWLRSRFEPGKGPEATQGGAPACMRQRSLADS
jgi:hypothetical protein